MNFHPKLSSGVSRNYMQQHSIIGSGIIVAWRSPSFAIPKEDLGLQGLAQYGLERSAQYGLEALAQYGKRCGPCTVDRSCAEGGIRRCVTPGQEPISGLETVTSERVTYECCNPQRCGPCQKECISSKGKTYFEECNCCKIA